MGELDLWETVFVVSSLTVVCLMVGIVIEGVAAWLETRGST